jgi:hypothetical protein
MADTDENAVEPMSSAATNQQTTAQAMHAGRFTFGALQARRIPTPIAEMQEKEFVNTNRRAWKPSANARGMKGMGAANIAKAHLLTAIVPIRATIWGQNR